jgi:hypothetical protein
VRLVFAFDGDEVTLVSSRPVEMTVPLTHTQPRGESEEEGEVAPPEFVAELRGAEDQVLHRTQMPNPLVTHREVFSDDEERSVRRVPVEHPSGAFTVVVPDHPEGEYVALMASPPPDHAPGLETLAPTREVGRFSLRGEEIEGV